MKHFGFYENLKDEKIRQRIVHAIKNNQYLQTERLFLMPLEVSDAPEAFKWSSDPEVTKYMNYSKYTNVAEVEQWIAESGFNCFGFFLRENGQLIGSGDVHTSKRNGAYELGYNLAKAYWGKGYCTEASKAMLAYRVAQGITEFACEHAVDNVRSGRVIHKCGFVFTELGSYTSFDGLRTYDSKKYILHIDSHEMNVDGEWYNKIIAASKTIELRLNDEKCREIKEGDYIVLTSDKQKAVVKVTCRHSFDNFAVLYNNLDMTKCGYSFFDKPNPDDMLRYYSLERQQQYGVVGIEFELLAVVTMSI